MAHFNELNIRRNLAKDPALLLARFKNGLQPDIRKALRTNTTEAFDQTYQRACEIKSNLKFQSRRPETALTRHTTGSAASYLTRPESLLNHAAGATPGPRRAGLPEPQPQWLT